MALPISGNGRQGFIPRPYDKSKVSCVLSSSWTQSCISNPDERVEELRRFMQDGISFVRRCVFAGGILGEKMSARLAGAFT
ncbi:hypothetical protein KOW79_002054 [Hemibagrus wyckioides]|uniref:Uncharacterized protein n=1 Tax=Hemibagrus wyckioides TaxID=337641 RepID=A0A9D3P741_9TELE|nr:hypothetical protein KOW79_002054 [Hemibagrus wyckioides]